RRARPGDGQAILGPVETEVDSSKRSLNRRVGSQLRARSRYCSDGGRCAPDHNCIGRRIRQLFCKKLDPSGGVNVVLVKNIVVAIAIVTCLGSRTASRWPSVKVPPTFPVRTHIEFATKLGRDLLDYLTGLERAKICNGDLFWFNQRNDFVVLLHLLGFAWVVFHKLNRQVGGFRVDA